MIQMTSATMAREIETGAASLISSLTVVALTCE